MLHSEKFHILVIDDDERIRTLVTRYLWKNDFVTLSAENTEEAKELLKSFDIDLMVVDVMMPGQSGMDFTKEVRQQHINIPIILLTALGEVENRIEGLQKGADDYLPKPFDPQELVLRINAILKRIPKKSGSKEVQIGSHRFDKDQAVLHCKNGTEISLTELEGRLLLALLKTPNDPVSREKLAEMCDMAGTDRAIDVQMTRLRKKIEEDSSNPKLLKTVRGKGYALKVL